DHECPRPPRIRLELEEGEPAGDEEQRHGEYREPGPAETAVRFGLRLRYAEENDEEDDGYGDRGNHEGGADRRLERFCSAECIEYARATEGTNDRSGFEADDEKTCGLARRRGRVTAAATLVEDEGDLERQPHDV